MQVRPSVTNIYFLGTKALTELLTMTKDEAVQHLTKLGKSSTAPVDVHLKADEILLAVMQAHGLKEVVDAYRSCENEIGGFWFEWNR